MTELIELSLSQAHDLIKKHELSPVELINASLAQIETVNPHINAFIQVTPVLAIQQAHQAEAVIKRRKNIGLIRGIPIGLKDLIDVAGLPTTYGNNDFRENVANEDAAVFEKLRAAGSILMGKLNLHEIALGVTNENPHFRSCKNPWNPIHITGGSSGGNAAALATGMVMGAIGTDTGGSIRIPASLCGIVGLKPTYGRVSVRGVQPLSWNLDHVGPMARTVEDAAIIFKVIAGYDSKDPYSIKMPVKNPLLHLKDGVQGWRIALADDRYFDDADPEILNAIQLSGEVFADLGAEVERVPFPGGREAAYANGLMVPADASYVYRDLLSTQPTHFGADVLKRLRTGAEVSLAEYQHARRVQVVLRCQFEAFFQDYDLLITPTTPMVAPRRGADPVERAKSLTHFTAPFNFTGLPAISLPCGFSQSGLPIGLQLITSPWQEAKLLQGAYAFEQTQPPARLASPSEIE